MSSLLKILLSVVVTSWFSLNIAVADNSELESLKRTEKGVTEIMEFCEKKIDFLQKDIKKWEFQLTGPRRFFYPKGFVRDTIKGWIKDYKIELSKKKKELAGLKESRERILGRIVNIETTNQSVGGSISEITITERAIDTGTNKKTLTWKGKFTRVGTKNDFTAEWTGGNLGSKRHIEKGLSIEKYKPREQIVINRPRLGKYKGEYQKGQWKGTATWYKTGWYWEASIDTSE